MEEDSGAALEEEAAALEEGDGTLMETPAEAHVCSTPLITSVRSEGEQAFSTQGWTELRSFSDFWQWHLMSVMSQPSVPKAVMKHCKAHCGRFASCAEATPARATKRAGAKVFMLALDAGD